MSKTHSVDVGDEIVHYDGNKEVGHTKKGDTDLSGQQLNRNNQGKVVSRTRETGTSGYKETYGEDGKLKSRSYTDEASGHTVTKHTNGKTTHSYKVGNVTHHEEE